jgi:hypothetical protein
VLADAYVHELGENEPQVGAPAVLQAPLGTGGRISQNENAGSEDPAYCRPHPCAGVYRASGSGRIWKWITLLVVPFPVSMWNGARVLIVDQRPRPFHPPFGSSIRPSIHFV